MVTKTLKKLQENITKKEKVMAILSKGVNKYCC